MKGGVPVEQKTVLELFDRHADTVYRTAISLLRSPQDAEDAVQAVFLKLLEGGVTVYPGRERAFLTKATINHGEAADRCPAGRGRPARAAGGP